MRARLVLLVIVVWLAPWPVIAEIRPLTGWRQMRSANFLLLGDVSEGELRRVAGRFEQFRAAVGRLLPKASMTTATPTTVLVFRSHRNLHPFKPVHDGKVSEHIAGYFLGGQASNFIVLTTETRGEGNEDQRFGIIYHELVHLMVNNTVRGVPVWFNEGLAEYYRTLEITSNGSQVIVGRAHAPHLLRLREQFIPVEQLAAVGHGSPLYNEGSKASIFYAESWALVHYLLLGDQQKHAANAARLLDALAAGTPFAEACHRSLGISPAQLEKALRSYVGRESFSMLQWTFTERLAAIERLTATPVDEADVHAIAGELLLGMGRAAQATEHLEFALERAPDHTRAHATLGMLHARANRADLAAAHLRRAAGGAGATAQTHFQLAVALLQIRESGGDAGTDADARIEAALRQAIALDAGFAEPYAALARLLAARAGFGTGSDEAVALQHKAATLSPGRDDYQLNLAIYLSNRQRFAEALPLLTPLARGARDAGVKAAAGDLLKRIAAFEQKAASGEIVVERAADGPRVIQFDLRPVRDGEAQLKGVLRAIECPREGVRLVVEHDGRTSRVHAASFDGIEFITYRQQEGGTISCGARPAGDRVIVTYRPASHESSLGPVVAVEFMPAPR